MFYDYREDNKTLEDIELEKLKALIGSNSDNISNEMDLFYDVEGTMDVAYADEMVSLKSTDYITDEQKAKDTRISILLKRILDEAVAVRTTDIQISVPKNNVIIRYRVDGKMKNIRKVEFAAMEALSCRIKLLCGLDISEFRVPQDGRFSHIYKDKVYDVRVNTLPTNKAENISLRLLYKEELNTDLSKLNFREHVLSTIRNSIHGRDGLILLTGPTGSGKTTTLYTSIGELVQYYNNEKTIMTIEDPIEYAVDNIVQSQVNLVRNYDFSDGLRAILRQNPDIILVGEIRDLTTAKTAVRASTTGHLVFSTLHATDAVSTAIVLKQLGVEPYNISNSLKLVVNQRLVGRLCDHCKTSRLLTREERKIFPEIEESWSATGCEHCGYKGTVGLVLLVEMLKVDEQFKTLIYKDVAAEEMKNLLKENKNYYSLREDIIHHLKLGEISIDDGRYFL